MNKHDLKFFNESGMIKQVNALYNRYNDTLALVVTLQSTEKYKLYGSDNAVYVTMRGEQRNFKTMKSIYALLDSVGVEYGIISIKTIGVFSDE